jgi:hypothetical protein
MHHFCFNNMGKHAQSTDSRVLDRIKRHGAGWVFSAADFGDLGSPTAIRLALMRHARKSVIRNVSRGLYDLPRQLPRIGFLPPSSDEIVQAVQARNRARIQPSGAHAANLLGLSDQVPVRAVFLTDGRSRTIRFGKQKILFKHATTRQMAVAGRVSGTVIQALRWLGRQHVGANTVATLRRRLSDGDKKQLLQDLRFAPAWVADLMRQVAQSATGPKRPVLGDRR